MATRLSSQPLPLSPSAVTLNNTLSLITATITLRNKLVFFQRGTEMGKRRPLYASGLPFSLQHLNLSLGTDRLQINLVLNSLHFIILSLAPARFVPLLFSC